MEETDDCPPGEEYDEMKQEIRSMLLKNTNDPSQTLKLIDIVQRLGVAYHFKTEIEDQLSKFFNINFEDYHNDLYIVALHFRLLRQHGFKVSCDVFEKFKDEDRKFKESLSEDIGGLLSLYEAAFLGIRGEDILDEARDFTTKKLQLLIPNLSPNLAEEVAHAINRPIRKNMPRLEARYFIRIYEADESHNKTLAKFAKLDFNMLQVLHQKELKDALSMYSGSSTGTCTCIKPIPIHVSIGKTFKDMGILFNFMLRKEKQNLRLINQYRWWKHWDFTTKLPYARERIWEVLCWAVGAYFEPQYSEGRKLLTKITTLFSIVDDTYDNYGETEELESFTQVIQRWDLEAVDALPEKLQIIFRSLTALINEIEEIATREGRPFYTYYAKEFINRVVGNYLNEVKWRDAKYVPTIEEYMPVCTLSTGYPMLTVVSFIGMKEIATKETFGWILDHPKSVEAAAIICRLMDDIVSHTFEQESRDHVASSVECYVKQYKTSEEEAIKMLRKDIENAWKDINESFFRPTPVSMDILELILNLCRVMDVYYKDGDGYSNPLLIKDYVASVLNDPLL